MYICICNAVTDKEIRKAARSGVKDLWGLQRQLGVAAGCGTCSQSALDVLRDASSEARCAEPRLYQPAMA